MDVETEGKEFKREDASAADPANGNTVEGPEKGGAEKGVDSVHLDNFGAQQFTKDQQMNMAMQLRRIYATATQNIVLGAWSAAAVLWLKQKFIDIVGRKNGGKEPVVHENMVGSQIITECVFGV